MSAIWERVAGRRVLALDLDGVVYTGASAVPGAPEAIARLRARGFTLAFLTNNSARTRAKIADKLSGLGVPCEARDVTTSGQAAAELVRSRELDGGRGVFVFGSDELREEVRSGSLAIASPSTCGAVVVGFDPAFAYEGLANALEAGLRGVPIVACNRDASFPVEGGRRLPGCGAMTGALEGCLGRRVDHEAGKPEPLMLDLLLARLGATREDAIVVGDSFESDIAMARRAGVPSVLLDAEPGDLPDDVIRCASLAELANAIEANLPRTKT